MNPHAVFTGDDEVEVVPRRPPGQPSRLEATTWTEYARKIRNQILPRIGSVPLQQLKPVHLKPNLAETVFARSSALTPGRVVGLG